MAGLLESAQNEQANQVAEMEAVGSRVEADVERHRGRAGREKPFEFVAIGHVGNQPAPLQVL
jgi:hypothetical protein